ncbi:PfkB family carbohydrate kinase, partial [Enterococcus faecalis]
ACLASKPFIIKPNNEELSEIFNVKIESVEDIIYYAKKLQEEGAENVLVSLGAKGALLVAANGEVYQSDVPNGQVVNPTGAGDSMLAGF